MRLTIGFAVIFLLAGFKETQAECDNIQTWCDSVSASFCESVPSMKTMCPLLCDACLPEECSECKHNCTLKDGSYKCSCYEGYRLHPDGKNCEDINECEERKNICRKNENGTVCENEDGGYTCSEGLCSRFHAQDYASYYERSSECCKLTYGECGQNLLNSGRVVEGRDAKFGRWPWQAFILLKNNLCGGSLINELWVVSAAHCLESIQNIRKERVNIRLGVLRTDDLQNDNIELRRAVKLVIHEKYNFPRFDVALVKMSRRVTYSDSIRPICLPNGEVPAAGTMCYVTGYGVKVVGGGVASVLQEADVPIVDGKVCQTAYKGEFDIDTARMICAGRKTGGKDACQGDSGGPLVCQRCNNCDWFLAGITSFGLGCGEAGYYGVYANVEFFEKWIEANAEQAVQVRKRKCTPPRWTKWGGWGKCTKSCGGGSQSRLRVCRGGEAGLPGCLGKNIERQGCNPQPCEETAEDSWTDWTACSTTCGGGRQSRDRICERPQCLEETERRDCNKQDCPVWDNWEDWSKCQPSCGAGERTRARTCLNGEPGDVGCEGEQSEKESCTNGPCAGWKDWGEWTTCPVTCGGAEQTSTRECEGGVAGMDCPGSSKKTRPCGTNDCPVPFEEWGAWEKCSAECGEGTQSRTRSCSVDKCEPDEFGSTTKQTRKCKVEDCPGEWTMWSPWDACSAACGPGTRRRIRSCEGGSDCPGDNMESESCNVQDCPGKWSDWLAWGRCSATCGRGKRSRTRTCEGGTDCRGLREQTETCTAEKCAQWTEWSRWGDCSETCDGGTRERTRTCLRGTTEAKGCPGRASQVEDCGTEECIVSCSPHCQQQVFWAYCVRNRIWMENRCELDCCGKFCKDKRDDCRASDCRDPEQFDSCLRYCGYCV